MGKVEKLSVFAEISVEICPSVRAIEIVNKFISMLLFRLFVKFKASTNAKMLCCLNQGNVSIELTTETFGTDCITPVLYFGSYFHGITCH